MYPGQEVNMERLSWIVTNSLIISSKEYKNVLPFYFGVFINYPQIRTKTKLTYSYSFTIPLDVSFSRSSRSLSLILSLSPAIHSFIHFEIFLDSWMEIALSNPVLA